MEPFEGWFSCTISLSSASTQASVRFLTAHIIERIGTAHTCSLLLFVLQLSFASLCWEVREVLVFLKLWLTMEIFFFNSLWTHTRVISVKFQYVVSRNHDWSLAGGHQSVRNTPPIRPDWLRSLRWTQTSCLPTVCRQGKDMYNNITQKHAELDSNNKQL